MFVFHNECVDNRSGYRRSHLFDTLENQIRKNGDTGRRLIIKMDIEGAEWDSLLAAPEELLASIPQITMEMHGFDDPKIVEVLRKLKRNFYLVNLHFNKLVVYAEGRATPSMGVSGAMGKQADRRCRSGGTLPAPMSQLNAPDSPTWPDCQLHRSRSQH